MSYLQLAEDKSYYLAERNPKELYLFVPAGYRGSERDQYIREDLLDNLPEEVFNQMMNELEPYQNTGLSGKGADRRAARRQRRQDRKTARRDAKQKRVETRSGAFKGFVDTVGGAVSNIFGGGAKSDPGLDMSYTDGQFQATYGEEPSFFEKNKFLILIGGAAIVGGVIYFTMKKK